MGKDTKFRSCVTLKFSVIHKTYRYSTKAIWLVYSVYYTTPLQLLIGKELLYQFVALYCVSGSDFGDCFSFLSQIWMLKLSFLCFIHYRCCSGCHHFYCHIQFNPLNDARKVKKECVFCARHFIRHVIQNG